MSLGLMLVINTLIELIVMSPQHKQWARLLPKDDEQLRQELVTAFLRYLGIAIRAEGRKGR